MLKAICSNKDLASSEYYSMVADIIGNKELERLRSITHHIRTTRFQHCLNVSYYSYLFCRKFGMDSRAAARAGLLHDLFFYDRKAYNMFRRKGQPSHSEMHARQAAENAVMLTPLSELELDIIKKHMWPMTRQLPKYKESYVITVVDKYCAVLEFCVPTLKKAFKR